MRLHNLYHQGRQNPLLHWNYHQAAATNFPTYAAPSPSPTSMKLRTERAPHPKFDGNVRNYLDFRRDFRKPFMFFVAAWTKAVPT